MASIYIGVPNLGEVHRNVCSVLLNMQATVAMMGHSLVRVDLAEGKPIEHNRNTIVRNFLETDADFLFFMDADNPPIWDMPERNPLKLVDLDLDIIGLPTPIFYSSAVTEGRWPISWNVYDKTGDGKWIEHSGRGGLEEVDAIGSGCFLTARRVFEKVRPAFERIYGPDGTTDVGSDLTFSQRSKDAGFKIYAHFGHPCQHVKNVDIASVWLGLKGRDIAATQQKNPNSPEFWDKKWLDAKPAPQEHQAEVASLLKGLKVLDFGSGRGDLLSQLGPDAQGLDYSPVAVEIARGRGLKATLGSEIEGQYDVITAMGVLQTLEDDLGMIETFFEHTNTVIFSVPHNRLPPGVCGENLRVYTRAFVEHNFPNFKGFLVADDEDLVAILSREEVFPWERKREPLLVAS